MDPQQASIAGGVVAPRHGLGARGHGLSVGRQRARLCCLEEQDWFVYHTLVILY